MNLESVTITFRAKEVKWHGKAKTFHNPRGFTCNSLAYIVIDNDGDTVEFPKGVVFSISKIFAEDPDHLDA